MIETDRKTDIQSDRRRERETYRQTDRKIERGGGYFCRLNQFVTDDFVLFHIC